MSDIPCYFTAFPFNQPELFDGILLNAFDRKSCRLVPVFDEEYRQALSNPEFLHNYHAGCVAFSECLKDDEELMTQWTEDLLELRDMLSRHLSLQDDLSNPKQVWEWLVACEHDINVCLLTVLDTCERISQVFANEAACFVDCYRITERYGNVDQARAEVVYMKGFAAAFELFTTLVGRFRMLQSYHDSVRRVSERRHIFSYMDIRMLKTTIGALDGFIGRDCVVDAARGLPILTVRVKTDRSDGDVNFFQS